MTPVTLALRGLTFHWRSHLGVLLGAVVGSAVLVGALVVGDSVRYTLRRMAIMRLGQVRFAVASGERLFRDKLADDLSEVVQTQAAPVLQLPGSVVRSDRAARASNVQVLGVDTRFEKLGNGVALAPGADEVVLNERLAAQLSAKLGDSVVLKVNKPSGLSRDAPLSTEDDATVRIRLTVSAIVTDLGFGRFGLQANQVPPFNAFVSLKALQKSVSAGPRANLLLLGGDDALTLERAEEALKKTWTLEDAELELREIAVPSVGKVLELRTRRVFLDGFVADQALKVSPDARGILGYFVNGFQAGEQTTPYSMVAALGPPIVPDDTKDDEIVINQWLAEDLNAKVGDRITVKYYVMGPMRKLEERSSAFQIKKIVPIEKEAADRELMPDFPGLKDAQNCKDWDPGFKIDTNKIRDKDEKYWDDHRGTPKAFVSLKQGMAIWKSRFGEYTAIRYPFEPGAKERLTAELRKNLDPKLAGLVFLPVREQALRAGDQAQDFGQLFIGFSFFLILAALILMGLLFRFSIERRAAEIGALLAVGFTSKLVRNVLLLEGLGIATLGGALGVGCGLYYARAMLYGLSTAWRDAVRTSALFFHAEPITLAIGLCSSVVIVMFTIWFGVRSQAKRPARELLGVGTGVGSEASAPPTKSGWAAYAGVACVALALALVAWAGPRRDEAAAGAFFGAGFLLLTAGLTLGAAILSRLGRAQSLQPSAAALSLRNMARRRGRSLATLGLLASGVFLVAAVGANRMDPKEGAMQRTSGTGGFSLLAHASLPLMHDLNSPAGREAYTMTKKDLDGVSFVQIRVHSGDEASCLNLNRAQSPQLWGVRPEALAERGAFSFSSFAEGHEGAANPWLLLNGTEADGFVPAIGDSNSVTWALGKGVGETLDFVDERGKAFKIRIVATLATSILQGGLLIDENRFIERFPSESGYRMFLVDAPTERAGEVSAYVSERLEDFGFEVNDAARRLAEFSAVENTYLSTFQVLGGLGLLLGSIGMGVVVLRNVLERRGELALLRAVGFKKSTLRWLVAGEHGVLLLAGLFCGLMAAAVAVVPALRSPGAEIPYESLGWTMAGVLVSGLVWTWLAVLMALRGNLLDGLRNDGA